METKMKGGIVAWGSGWWMGGVDVVDVPIGEKLMAYLLLKRQTRNIKWT